MLHVYCSLLIAWLYGIQAPAWGYPTVLTALVLNGLRLGGGLLLSSVVKQLENFAGVMFTVGAILAYDPTAAC